MVEATGFFNYRPDLLTAEGTKKPAGFTGNTMTGNLPIAEQIGTYDSRLYKVFDPFVDMVGAEVIRAPTRAPTRPDPTTNPTIEYVEPEKAAVADKDTKEKLTAGAMVVIPIIVIGMVLLWIIKKVL